MKDVNGIWLPDHEEHLLVYADRGPHGKWEYQTFKLEAALPYLKQARTAIDVGAHCGLWSKELVRLFRHVHAFEPVEEHRACYVRNVRQDNYTLHPCAVGNQEGTVAIYTTPSSSGMSWVDAGREGDIPLKRLDDFGIDDVDFIKLDCEGYELFALQGAEQMLRRHRPVVIVEQKRGHGGKFGLTDTAAVDYLLGLGATLHEEMLGDYILSWR